MKKVGKATRPFRYDVNQTSYNYIVEVTNRFKGLDLMDRVPEELRMEVRDTDRRQGSRPSPRKRNANRQSGCLRALQIAEKRRKAKDERKGNAEFQRISRRD